ncbi:MAG: DUF7672 family protein [Patescibacteria group bacterium]
MKLLKIFLIGVWVLILALVANFLAMRFGINTWYGFVNNISDYNLVTAITHQTSLDIIFLFLIYPLILGIPGWVYFKLVKGE